MAMTEMEDYNLTRSQKAMFYLIDRLITRIEGRKKLMKLMFLIEHYDPRCQKLTEKQLLGNNFIIYRYGVFSRDVMNDYLKLGRMNILDDYPIKILEHVPLNLEDDIKSRIDQITNQFGKDNSSKLELDTLDLLGLDKSTKMKYFEKSVLPLIEAKNRNTEPCV